MTRPFRTFRLNDDRIGVRRQFATVLIACSVVLAACGADSPSEGVEEDRQFANDPVAEQRATPTDVPTDVAGPSEPETAPQVSPEQLLSSPGAAKTLYTVQGTDLLALTLSDGATETTSISLPHGWSLIDYESSVDGDRVAVLMSSGWELSLGFFERSGEIIGEPRSLPEDAEGPATPGATPVGTAPASFSGTPRAMPVATPMATPEIAYQASDYSITWSPEGTEALVMGPVHLIRMPVEGEASLIEIDDKLGAIREAKWSTGGAEVALIVEQDDTGTRTYLLNLDDQDIRELRSLRTTPDERIGLLSWMPDGSGVVFVRSTLAEDVPLQGRVFHYRLGQEVPTLVATSGQGGPSATITDLEPSPDGDSIAYVISVRDGERWAFHSMWVRSFSDGLSYRVPVDGVASVPQMWWFDGGIAWKQRSTHKIGPGEILFMNATVSPAVILDTDGDARSLTTPAATPMATPVLTPVATPHG